jgi:signal transduction histidine kinase
MTEETIEQIFHAFHQADSTLTRAYEGLGLGLSLVEKIVTLINGHIEVESELGKGSNFAILLPYEPVAVI